ncbi:MAG: helix-turn-helix domain-containing protein [Bacteroidaceae bacterium]|nr:helix-turn-helix domain-containing protein [Bacteroidaceae bacterium]
MIQALLALILQCASLLMSPLAVLDVMPKKDGQETCPLVKLEVERLPDLTIPRTGHSTFCVGDEIVVMGGHTSGFIPTATAEYFRDGKWHVMNTTYQHDHGFSVLLKSGLVMVGGGHEQHLGIGQIFAVEFYNPVTHSIEGFGCLDKKRCMATGLELDSGQVVITGNWYTNDEVECYNGQDLLFSFVKTPAVERAWPYIFRTSHDDAIMFSRKDSHGQLFDTIVVDRLLGEPFRVPLFDTWRPMEFHAPFYNADSFIGDEAKGVFSYLLPVENKDGQIAIAQVRNGEFQLLPTVCPVPMQSRWGRIHYLGQILADRKVGKGYLTGYDEDRRIYVLSIDYTYDKQGEGMPLTLYYTEPQDSCGCYPPVLTSDGNLVIAGGQFDSNFKPVSTVLLLRMNDYAIAASSQGMKAWLWGLVLLACLVILFYLLHLHRGKMMVSPSGYTDAPEVNADDNADLLMQRICDLMEQRQWFLNSELKVSDVAKELGTNSRYVSDCIKAKRDCSFTQFVNGYRVEHAKGIMHDCPDMKIATLSMESGFSNETSFFRTFKAFTNMTPREWMAQND